MIRSHIIRPNISRSVLYICDIQERFKQVIPLYNTIVKKIELLNQGAHELAIPTIITEHVPKVFLHTDSDITRYPEWRVFSKTKFSMITEEVAAAIPEGRNQAIICGLEGHVCVMQTALDLLEKNYDVFLVLDAIGSQRPHDRHVAINRLTQNGAIVTTSESILFDLMVDAKHPSFKKVSSLIKEHKENNKEEFAERNSF